MGTAERRLKEKERLRARIVEAARDIVSEGGLDALSMRAIAERIEYSPATLYLYFRDKDELVREVVREGFSRLEEYMRAEVSALPRGATPIDRYQATGRAYARFAVENTAYFRVMFELPSVARLECSPEPGGEEPALIGEDSWWYVVGLVRQAAEEGRIVVADAERAAIVGWGLVHGLVSLYVAGHLAERIRTVEEFLSLVESAMASLHAGWKAGG